jgi:tetratricopeptide (TPR) repeat protein
MTRLPAFALALAATGCAFGNESVTRVYHGHEEPGRYVSHYAYAAYAEGTLREARGDLRGAASAYDRALAQDDASVEVWTRLGSLRCQLGQTDADQAFDRALELDRRYEPAWRERARCALGRGDIERAEHAAQRAFELDPDNERTTLLLAELMERQGHPDQALIWLDAWVTRDPTSTAGYTALFALAKRRGDSVRRIRAESALELLSSVRGVPESERRTQALERLDGALRRGDLFEARREAPAAQASAATIALRAAALGRLGLARTQARWVLDADPRNADGWIAWAAAATSSETEAPPTPSARAPQPAGTASPLGVRLLADLLLRRVGANAARAWLSAHQPLPPPADALEREVEARLASVQDR